MQAAYTEVHQRTRKDTEGQARTPAENKNFEKKTFQTIAVAIVLAQWQWLWWLRLLVYFKKRNRSKQMVPECKSQTQNKNCFTQKKFLVVSERLSLVEKEV